MKVRSRAVAGVLSIAALVGAAMVGVAGPAMATQPPYEPDPHALGQIHFYNAAGVAVTSGNVSDDPFAQYAVATTSDPQSANTHATLYAYTPQSGVDQLLWSGEALTGATVFPVTNVSAPTIVKNAGAHVPVVTLDTVANGNTNLANYIADFPNGAAAGTPYAGLYQLRMVTPGNDPKYWAADVMVSGSTWTLVYPATATVDPSSLSISTPRAANYGVTANITGKLTDTTTSAVIAGASVGLYKRLNSSSAWTYVITKTTSSTGIVTAPVNFTSNDQWYWHYAGAAGTHAAVNSATNTVPVLQTIKIAAKPTSVVHGHFLKFYGTVSPAGAGQNVTLQSFSSSAWHNVATTTLKSQLLPSGVTTVGYVFNVKLVTVGSFQYRVVKFATTTLGTGISPTSTVKAT